MEESSSSNQMRSAARVRAPTRRAVLPEPSPQVDLGGSLRSLQGTVGNHALGRLVQGRAKAPLGARTVQPALGAILRGLQRSSSVPSGGVLVQRYTEDDVRTRAAKIYQQRIKTRPPGAQTEAEKQKAAEADWAQAQSDLKQIEVRAHEIAEDRKKNPGKYPKDAGPLSDWLQAEREIDRQSNFNLIAMGSISEAGAPAEIGLPKSLQTGMETAWKGSFPGGASQEQGGTLVKNKDGSFDFKAGASGSSGMFSPNWGDKGADQDLVGSIHTHPYSKAEGGFEDVSFSGDDISTMIFTGEKTAFVQSGKTQFAVTTTAEWDAMLKPLTLAEKKKLSTEIEATWDAARSSAKGTFQARVEAAVKAVCAKYHLVYYRGAGGTLSKQ